MVLSTALLLGGAAIGGGAGFVASRKRSVALDRQFRAFATQAEAQEKMAQARKSILAGNLSIAALKTNRSMKESAEAAYQNESAANAAIAGSGLTKQSTPAYKLALDVMNQRSELDEYMRDATMGLAQMGLEADAQGMALDAEVQATRNRLMDIGEESAYADSAFSSIVGTLTGAFSGASAASSLMSMGVDSGLLSEKALSTELGDTETASYLRGVSNPENNFNAMNQPPVIFDSLLFNIPGRGQDPAYTRNLGVDRLLFPPSPSWLESPDLPGSTWDNNEWSSPFKGKAKGFGSIAY